jgi:hypothetical protein
MNNLATAYMAGEQFAKAIPLIEETLEKQKIKFGPDHPHTLIILCNLAAAYKHSGQLSMAGQLFKDTVEKMKVKLGAEHLHTLATMSSLGSVLLLEKKWTEAESVLRDCLAACQKQIPDNWRTFNTQALLGGALLGQEKYADAEPLLLAGYAGIKAREQTIPQNFATRSRIPESLDRLIELYTATDKPDEVKKWQAEREKYPQGNIKTPQKE